jgi:hypothetical protein
MFDGLRSAVSEKFAPISNFVKNLVFGKNNERLDFALDSFYKLPPQRRTAVLATLASAFALLVISIFFLYFSRVNALDSSLNASAVALREFYVHQAENEEAKADLKLLEGRIKSRLQGFSIKPFFEKISSETGVEIRSTKVKGAETVALEELSSFLSEQDVEIVIASISLPKLLKFISTIEKSQNYIRVKDLRIRDLSGKKLYFEVQVFFRAFQLS